jgi:hypothetical protein
VSAIHAIFDDTDHYAPLQGTSFAEPTDLDALNELLRGEMSAAETYDLAILKFKGHLGVDELKVIRDEHSASAALLRDRILAHGGEPSETSGAWGTFATSITSVAKVLGIKTVLATLRQGEEHGVKGYEGALDNDQLSAECRELIADDLLPRCRIHVGELQELSDTI